ncbi:hypothetical protein K3495_g3672 [Podosphaera aphanis]|nr:hypothetical protein K3495_g3672 [Podosphaera aphanis]
MDVDVDVEGSIRAGAFRINEIMEENGGLQGEDSEEKQDNRMEPILTRTNASGVSSIGTTKLSAKVTKDIESKLWKKIMVGSNMLILGIPP